MSTMLGDPLPLTIKNNAVMFVMDRDKMSNMTSTLMTSVFFRHGINIHDFSVFKTRHLKFMTQVFFTWHQPLWHQCFLDMTSTFITLVFLRHVIYIYNISVFLDMTSTLMTLLLFKHDIYIYNISVFHTWHLHW